MTAIVYTIEVAGLDAQIDEVERIAAPPSFRTIGRLEHVLRQAFLQTKARTHVITGSLKNSGRSSTTFDGDEWTGTIVYGGPSPGFPNDPVDYAIYEMARGGDHDFFSDLPAYDPLFQDAVLEHFRAG